MIKKMICVLLAIISITMVFQTIENKNVKAALGPLNSSEVNLEIENLANYYQESNIQQNEPNNQQIVQENSDDFDNNIFPFSASENLDQVNNQILFQDNNFTPIPAESPVNQTPEAIEFENLLNRSNDICRAFNDSTIETNDIKKSSDIIHANDMLDLFVNIRREIKSKLGINAMKSLGFTKEETVSIYLYTSICYEGMNLSLNNNDKFEEYLNTNYRSLLKNDLSEEQKNNIMDEIKQLFSLSAKVAVQTVNKLIDINSSFFPSYKDKEVYRGAIIPDDEFNNIVNGREYNINTLLSTSTQEGVAKRYIVDRTINGLQGKLVLFKIKLHKDWKMIDKVSINYDEWSPRKKHPYEVILTPGCKLNILSSDKTDIVNGIQYTILECEEVID